MMTPQEKYVRQWRQFFVSGEPVSESACERCLLLLQLSYREVIYVEPFMALKSNQRFNLIDLIVCAPADQWIHA